MMMTNFIFSIGFFFSFQFRLQVTNLQNLWCDHVSIDIQLERKRRNKNKIVDFLVILSVNLEPWLMSDFFHV